MNSKRRLDYGNFGVSRDLPSFSQERTSVFRVTPFIRRKEIQETSTTTRRKLDRRPRFFCSMPPKDLAIKWHTYCRTIALSSLKILTQYAFFQQRRYRSILISEAFSMANSSRTAAPPAVKNDNRTDSPRSSRRTEREEDSADFRYDEGSDKSTRSVSASSKNSDVPSSKARGRAARGDTPKNGTKQSNKRSDDVDR